jgi:RimJ/RimL family protein N-acetyltransferase
MLLRAATPEDVPALVDVQEAGAVVALAHIFPQEDHPFPRAAIEARWAEEIRDPGIDAFLIQRDGRIDGFAALKGDQLLHFGTARETWGSGLARQAHDELIERLRVAGITVAWLRVFEENRRARRFYEKAGWHATGRSERSLFAPYPVLVRYEISLG